MKPAFVVGGLYSQANGVALIMRDLAAALGTAGAPVTVFGAECHGRRSIGEIFDPPSRWVAAEGVWLGGLSWSPRLKGVLRSHLKEVDVVHNHSVWMLPNSYGSRIGRAAGKPVVITAHGALEPWALGNSGWKKRIAGMAFQDRDLRSADCIHVNSERELAGIRAYGLKNPVAVIPNGVRMRDFDDLPAREVFDQIAPETRDKRICLFLSRLHSKKGLKHLTNAWKRVTQDFPDWHLVIAGPDDGYEKELRRDVESAGIGNSATLTGPLFGRQKVAAYSAADFFALPSFSEGFSMAILEAMACALPVMITPGCNFPEAVTAGAAVEIAPDAAGTEDGLRRLMGLEEPDRAAMGRAARALVEEKYTWSRVAAQIISVYQWLCGRGPQPVVVVDG